MDDLVLSAVATGTRITVRVRPGSRRSGVQGVHAGQLVLAVHAAPERGKANAALTELLAELLDLRKAEVELVSGATASEKQFVLHGIEPDEVRRRLVQA